MFSNRKAELSLVASPKNLASRQPADKAEHHEHHRLPPHQIPRNRKYVVGGGFTNGIERANAQQERCDSSPCDPQYSSSHHHTSCFRSCPQSSATAKTTLTHTQIKSTTRQQWWSPWYQQQFEYPRLILPKTTTTSEYNNQICATADSMDRGAHGKVQQNSRAWSGNSRPILGQDSICQEFEGSCN